MQVIIRRLLSSLKQVFPICSILLVFYPFILGLFIEPDLFNPRNITINFVWISVFTIPVILSRNVTHHKLITTLFFIVGFMETTHWIVLNSPITITSLLVISNTYAQEVQEFSSVMLSPKILLLLPIFYLFYKALKNTPKKKEKLNNRLFVWLIGAFSILFITETAIHGRLIRKGVPNIAKTTFSFIEKIQLFKKALKDHKPRDLKEVTSKIPEQKQTTVIIIGESNSRRHMSIYGAKENTSPKLLNRNDIIIYNDVVSPFSTTIRSVLTILTQTNLEKEVDILENIDVLDIFHSAQFKNHWISNQCPIGIWDNQITEFSKKSDYNEFVNMTSSSSFEATYTPSYDEKLIAPLKKLLNNDNKKKLIVLHMIGNHMSYSKRYPNQFNQFEGDGSEQSNTKAEYKNSLLYTDYIVDSIFTLLDEQSKADPNHIISALYISDHGENVYDYKNQIGHGYSKSVPKVNVEVPFVVWLSKGFKTYFEEKSAQIKLNQNLPYVSDDLFHSLIDISGIKTSYLDTTRSIFHRGFNDKRKRILCDGNDYDLK